METRILRKQMTWRRETALVSFVRRGDRMLGFWARRIGGQWACIIVEGPSTTSADTLTQASEEVFNDHSHQALAIEPRKKGTRATFDDVRRAAEKFAREWRPGKASPCDCGPIAEQMGPTQSLQFSNSNTG